MFQCEHCGRVENAEFVIFGVVLCRQCRDHAIERFGGAAVRRVLTTLGQPSDAEYNALVRALAAFCRATNVFPGPAPTLGPLAAQVAQAKQTWRAQEKALHQWKRDVCQVGLNAELRGLLVVAVWGRRIYRRYLRRRFWYDARRGRFLRGVAFIAGTHDMWSLLVANLLYRFADMLLRAGTLALWEAAWEGETPRDSAAAAVAAMDRVSQNFSMIAHAGIELGSSDIAAAATVSLAGVAATPIRLFPSLREALGDTGDARKELLERLTGDVYHIWHGGARLISEFKTEVERVINQARLEPQDLHKRLSPESLRKARQEISQWGRMDISLEEWFVKQEASQRLNDLAEHARLTPREAEVLALVREGLTLEDIAQRLEIKIGTVKATKNHVVKQLRKAI